MVVLLRGDRFVLRIKDADSPTRTGFPRRPLVCARPELCRQCALDSLQAPSHRADSHRARHHSQHDRPRCRRVSAQGQDLPSRTGARRWRARQAVLHPCATRPTGPAPTRAAASSPGLARSRPGPAGQHEPRLQPALQSALRLHAVRHLPAAARDRTAYPSRSRPASSATHRL